jgi:integrase
VPADLAALDLDLARRAVRRTSPTRLKAGCEGLNRDSIERCKRRAASGPHRQHASTIRLHDPAHRGQRQPRSAGGADLKVVSDQLGHSSVLTADTYISVLPAT